jgi:hypothetical protein
MERERDLDKDNKREDGRIKRFITSDTGRNASSGAVQQIGHG